MKKLFVLIGFLVLTSNAAFAQEKLVKDIDGDKKVDTVYFDQESSKIVCALSTQKFKRIFSLQLEIFGDNSGVRSTKSGFEFYTNAMRGGCANQFRYDKKLEKIQLIGMSRYEFGNAANDGSGESSVNLLTNSYIGNWSYYDLRQEKLIKMTPIKVRMTFAKTYLETFSDKLYFSYSEKCAALYEKQKVVASKGNN